jgi:hypothetical protein
MSFLHPDKALSDDTDSSGATQNYFVRHWNGDLSLSISYWVNLVLVVGLGAGGLVLPFTFFEEAVDDLRVASFGWLLFWPMVYGLCVWGIVGVWRSATNNVDRSGPSGWATLAKAMVILSAFSAAFQMIKSAIPQMAELGKIAFGYDQFGENADIRLAENGTSIEISGGLSAGAADRFGKLLNSAPSVRLVVLNSNGGRIFEAEKIAESVNRKGLDTYVEDRCESACTLILLAGRDRATTPNARIGFHQPDFPGLDAEGRREIIDVNRNIYLKAGVLDAFIDRAMSASPHSMWYPSYDEMVAANVVNRLSTGGETNTRFSTFKTKESLKKELLKVAMIRSLCAKEPAIFDELLDQSWSARQRGETDSEIGAAGRAVMIRHHAEIVANASDAVLTGFADLAFDQLNAAKSLGVLPCANFMRGTLNVAGALPPKLVQRELSLMQAALDSPPSSTLDNLEGEQLLAVVVRKLTDAQLIILNNPQSTKDDKAVCQSAIALHTAIHQLQPRQRGSVTRYLYAAK